MGAREKLPDGHASHHAIQEITQPFGLSPKRNDLWSRQWHAARCSRSRWGRYCSGMALDKHRSSLAGAYELTPSPRCGFRRFTKADLPAVQHLHVTALHSTNAFIEVDDYYADLENIPGTYLKACGE